MNVSKNNFISIEQMTGQFLNNPVRKETQKKSDKTSFRQILEKKQTANQGTILKFSRHANERLESRNIDLTESQLKRLESGLQKAKAKGIQESLVMVDDLAFIVNVKNQTVITAVNNSEDKVFTNIDGAVII